VFFCGPSSCVSVGVAGVRGGQATSLASIAMYSITGLVTMIEFCEESN
jgi:hypothetical protein